MSLLHEVKGTPALIIKPRLVLVERRDELGWYITSNQQRQMFTDEWYFFFRQCNYKWEFCIRSGKVEIFVH